MTEQPSRIAGRVSSPLDYTQPAIRRRKWKTHSTQPLLRSLEVVCQSRCGRRKVRLGSAMLPFKQSLLLLVALSIIHGSPPSAEYSVRYEYLPAPPGRTPSCAKNGETYCENIDTYPKDLIQNLIEKKEYDCSSFYLNEYQDPRPVYGPPTYHHISTTSSHFQRSTTHLEYNISRHFEKTLPLPSFKDDHLQFLNNSFELNSAFRRPDLTANEPVRRRLRNQRSVRNKRQESSSTYLCPTIDEFITPQAAKDNRGYWRYIAQPDSEIRLQVLVAKCRNTLCDDICTLPNRYEEHPRCEQQYALKRLVALSKDRRVLAIYNFRFPHGCVCKITKDDRFK